MSNGLTGTSLLLTDQSGKTRVRVILPPEGQIIGFPPDETILLNGTNGHMTLKSPPNETILLNGANSSITIKSAGKTMISLAVPTTQGEIGFPNPTLTLLSSLGKKTI